MRSSTSLSSTTGLVNSPATLFGTKETDTKLEAADKVIKQSDFEASSIPVTLEKKVSDADTSQSYSSQWEEGLFDLGCSYDVLNAITKLKLIQDYKMLYTAVSKVPREKRCELKEWQLLVMSGEDTAIKHAYAMQDKQFPLPRDMVSCLLLLTGSLSCIKKNSVWIYPTIWIDGAAFFGENQVTMAIRSGSLEVLQYVLDRTPKYCINDKHKLLFYAAESGSAEMMRFIHRQFKCDTVCWETGDNLLHYAARSGSVVAMRCAVDEFKMDPKSVNKQGENALHLAAKSGSNEAICYALHDLEIDRKICAQGGESVLFSAGRSGSVSTMKYVINFLQLDPNHRGAGYRDDNITLLHCAVRSRSMNAVRYVLQISKDVSLKVTFSKAIHYLTHHCDGTDIDKFYGAWLRKLLSELNSLKSKQMRNKFPTVSDDMRLSALAVLQDSRNKNYIEIEELKKFFDNCIVREEKNRLIIDRDVLFSTKDLNKLCIHFTKVFFEKTGLACEASFSFFRDAIYIKGITKKQFTEVFGKPHRHSILDSCPVM